MDKSQVGAIFGAVLGFIISKLLTGNLSDIDFSAIIIIIIVVTLTVLGTGYLINGYKSKK